MFYGATYAIYIKNIVSPDAGDNLIEGNTFAYGTTSNCWAIHFDSGGGLRIIGNKVIGFEFAFDLNLQETTGVLIISGNSFEGQGTLAIKLAQGVAGKSFNSVVITGNQASGSAGFLSIGSGSGGTPWVNNFSITGNMMFNIASGGCAIYSDGTNTGIISGNTFYGPNDSSGTGINIGANAINTEIAKNSIVGFLRPISCASSSSTINHVLTGGLTFGQLSANITAAANGSIIYVSDGTKADPVAGSGTGCIAKRLNGGWVGN
jgi:hypothetical protein